MDVIELLEDLVRIDSVNPSMAEHGMGESAIADYLAGVMADLGLEVNRHEVSQGRPNVIATLPGGHGAPTLLFEAHLDTVAVPEAGLPVRRTGGRLHGRGACDTKGSCAAMVMAIARLRNSGADHPNIVFAGAMDEEVAMEGSRALVAQLPRVDGAIVGEPTSLRPVRVHNGIVRFSITAHGRAAHTSRADLGVNAISAAALVVTALETRLAPLIAERSHPLTGPALVTPAVIRGGVALNIVPDRCEIQVDRRLTPGESADFALAEVDAILDDLRSSGAVLTRHEPTVLLPAVETPSDHPLVRHAQDAVEGVLGSPVRAGGAPYGTDASNLWGVASIPCVVLGPGSIDQAHTDEEWVDLAEVENAVLIYEEIARRYAPTTVSKGAQ